MIRIASTCHPDTKMSFNPWAKRIALLASQVEQCPTEIKKPLTLNEKHLNYTTKQNEK